MSASGLTCEETGLCDKCTKVWESFNRKTSEENLLSVHTEHSHICAGRKCEVKKRTRQAIERFISALRNSGGGHILLHINGQRCSDRYLQHFDEFITRSFTILIEDGQLYVTAYERRWLSELEGFQDSADFLLITVKDSAGIATVDFNTKVKNDIENTRPQYLEVAEILFSPPNISTADENTEAEILRGITHLQNLHENRRVEIKQFRPNEERIKSDADAFANYVWNELKLKDNVTSMSKVHGGGSYFVGISETPSNAGYKTKNLKIDGISLTESDKARFTDSIVKKVKACTVVLQGKIYSDLPDNLLKVHFHPVPERQRVYVLEVAVRHFDGIVFSDKKGPCVYKIKDKKIQRMDKTEWLERFEGCFKKYIRED